MDASRAYYESLKAYDPMRELWTSLVNRSSNDRSLTSWSVQEKAYFAMCLLEGEVYNGGFDQYFSNSSADSYEFAVAGLTEIEALRSLRLVREAAETLFGENDPPTTQEGRWRIMHSKARRLSEVVFQHRIGTRLERLDKEFWTDPDQLGDRLIAYAKQHGLVGPFERSAD